MLTRLKVSGFKNLIDVDVSFGPFTCIAGANGTGKSNLFDAIRFLSTLANKTLLEAALSVRSEEDQAGDIRSLFYHRGNEYANTLSFEAEIIIPAKGTDDLGQDADATITFLKYSLELVYREDLDRPLLGGLEIVREELKQINQEDAAKSLKFPHSTTWRKSAIRGRRTTAFISTEGDKIKLSQDGVQGRSKQFLAKQLPRTILSTVNATENPTALLARREMQAWRFLQLEPSALRKPDEFTALPGIGSDGSHLPATLYHLAYRHQHAKISENGKEEPRENTWIYEQVARSLSELLDDVRSVHVDLDEKRKLLTVVVEDHNHTLYPARSLSDGTLRFLALAVLELDPSAQGVLCFEEPENGIHPERIPAILRLLENIAVDVRENIGADNPLRQVIINTHSPTVVMSVLDDSLIVAEVDKEVQEHKPFKRATFRCLDDTWRSKAGMPSVAKGKLLAYLNPAPIEQASVTNKEESPKYRKRRVIDRADLQPLLIPWKSEK